MGAKHFTPVGSGPGFVLGRWTCTHTHCHPGDEQTSDRPIINVVLGGLFVRHVGGKQIIADPTVALVSDAGEVWRFSEVLMDGLVGEMAPQQRGFIADIFGSGKHLLSLINDILDLSKVEAGKMMLDLERVDIASLFVNSLSIIREKAAIRRIQLSVEAPEQLGLFRADARKVKQIVYNLLSNAVKFTTDGGLVTLLAARVPRAAVGKPCSDHWPGRSFALADSDYPEFLEIRVTDTGIGITPDGLNRLFAPFSQIDSGLARRFEGTGLGLAMVKLLADLHGGAVAVESAVGEGSCFTVWLPFRPLAEEAPQTVASAKFLGSRRNPEQVESKTALIVEDDSKSAELIRMHLESEGFSVLHAESAEAGLVLAQQQPLALITLDITLPKMDGWEFLSRIREMPSLTSVPVVVITIAADRNLGLAFGVASMMQKPISRQELIDVLNQLGLGPPSPQRPVRVLVVDDDPTAVELMVLRMSGLVGSVLRAHGGREAIAAARRELPDLVILDLMMPEVSGFDVVRALREQPDTARIPIVVVTAKQVTDDDRAQLHGRVSAILDKNGLDPNRFLNEVRRATARNQPAVP